MTASFQSHTYNMDVSHLDDKMEIGTSPWPHADDIDLDFDDIRQPSVDRSMADDLEPTGNSTDPMQADDNPYNDDDMLDDDSTGQPYNPNDDLGDFNMDSYHHDGDNYGVEENEEIFYNDEETEPVEITIQNNNLTDAVEDVTQIVDDYQREPFEEVGEKSKIEDHMDNITNPFTENEQPHTQTTQPFPTPLETQSVQTEAQSSSVSEIQIVDFATQETIEPSSHDVENRQEDHTEESIESHQVTEDEDYQNANTEHEEEQPQTVPEASEIADTSVQEQEETMPKKSEQDLSRPADVLHPVTIVYMGQEMSLFPPMVDDASATFFVSDQALAYEPVDKLLASCREILGDSLEHDDELVLDISALGLHICEDSKYASQITLSQVIETYLTLSRNENTVDIEPLYCALSSRVCLASQYAYLTACASEGKHYSEIAAEYADSPEHEVASFDSEAEPDQPHKSEGLATAEDLEPENDELEIKDKTTSDGNVEHGAPDVFQDQGSQTSRITSDLAGNELQHDDIVTASKDADGQSDGYLDPVTGSPSIPQKHTPPEASATSTQGVNGRNVDDERTKVVEDGEDSIEQEDENIDIQENASASSHTVEGETDAAPEQNLDFGDIDDDDNDDVQQFQQEPQDESENFDYPEDLFKEEPDAFDGSQEIPDEIEDSAEAVGNEAQDNVHADVDDDTEYDHLKFDDTDGNVDGEDNTGTDENTDELDILEISDVTVGRPSTPSKLSGNSKRKVLDDDDLDILNTSTPEPKRTRAS